MCSFFGTSFRLNGEFRKRLDQLAAAFSALSFQPVTGLPTELQFASRNKNDLVRVQSLALGVRLFRVKHAIGHMRDECMANAMNIAMHEVYLRTTLSTAL